MTQSGRFLPSGEEITLPLGCFLEGPATRGPVVGTILAKRPLQRRITALAAAYAIALASLIASFGAARAAVEAISQPDGVICHGSGAERPAPVPDESSGKICVDSCCIGCLTTVAAVPPPVVTPVVPHSLSQRPALLTRFVLAAGTDFNAYRSRGPPSAS